MVPLLIYLQIVIEKLTKNVTEEHIREIFGVYGDIKFIDMPLNPHCTLVKFLVPPKLRYRLY